METPNGSHPTVIGKAIIVITQTLENQGAHSKPFTNHWRFKGQRKYLVSNCDNPANAVAIVMQMLGKPTPYAFSFASNWSPYEGVEKEFYDKQKEEWQAMVGRYDVTCQSPFHEIVIDVK